MHPAATLALLWVLRTLAATPPAHANEAIDRFELYNANGNATLEIGESPFDAVAKRQLCDAGYGYCVFGGCCPASNKCCPYGCLAPGNKCCLGGICGAGTDCCEGGCMPAGYQCCIGGGNCDPGNNCYWNYRVGRVVCCTDSSCTAHVENGKTIGNTPPQQEQTPPPQQEETPPPQASPTVPVPATVTEHATVTDRITVTEQPTVTQVRTQYYTFTVTWTYVVYYYTYNFIISASLVTSSTETTRSPISVLATAEDEASSEARKLTRTMSFPTPASATSLARFTGTTIYSNPSATAPGGAAGGAASQSRSSLGARVLLACSIFLEFVVSIW